MSWFVLVALIGWLAVIVRALWPTGPDYRQRWREAVELLKVQDDALQEAEMALRIAGETHNYEHLGPAYQVAQEARAGFRRRVEADWDVEASKLARKRAKG